MRSGQELQDLWFTFSTALQTQRDNWQQSVVSVWDAPPANVPAAIQPNPLPPLSQPTHGLLSAGPSSSSSSSLQDHSLGPLWEHFQQSSPLSTCPSPVQPVPKAGQVKATHMAWVRDRAQVLSGAVMARVKWASCCVPRPFYFTMQTLIDMIATNSWHGMGNKV